MNVNCFSRFKYLERETVWNWSLISSAKKYTFVHGGLTTTVTHTYKISFSNTFISTGKITWIFEVWCFVFSLEIYNKYKIFTPEWFLYLGDLDLLDEGLERRISYAILVATKPSGRQQLAKKAVHYGLHELNYCDGK